MKTMSKLTEKWLSTRIKKFTEEEIKKNMNICVTSLVTENAKNKVFFSFEKTLF